ncbi:MAG: DUF4124 domain-containing protein [Legionellales bacterium]|nr:DUF4124 domain-containing protein [Legionellales bacterium]
MRHTGLSVGLVLLMLSDQSFSSTIYKWTDSNGSVHFSDKPYPGAEEIKLPVVQSYSSPKNAQEKQKTQIMPIEATQSYERVSIAQPEDQSTIRNPQGYVPVIIELSPTLRKNDEVQMILDGAPLGAPQKATVFALKELLRGSHTIAIQVLDSKGNVLTSSQPITIYMMPPRVGMVHHNP